MRFLTTQLSSLSRSLWMAAQPSGISAPPPSFVSSPIFLRVHSIPSSRSLMNKSNKTGPSTDPWGTLLALLAYRRLSRLCTANHNPLSSAIQPVLNSPHCPLIHPTLPELAYEDVTGDSVESLDEVKVDNIHCSPLVYPASHSIIEGFQIG